MPAHAAFFSIYEITKKILGVKVDEFSPIAAGAVGIISCIAHDSIMTPTDSKYFILALK